MSTTPLIGPPEPAEPRVAGGSRALWIVATVTLTLSASLGVFAGPLKPRNTATAAAAVIAPAPAPAAATTVIPVYVVKASETAANNAENAEDVLYYLVGPLLPAGYDFSFATYESLNALLDAAEADDTLLSAGSVVLYPSIRSEVATRNYTGKANTTSGSRSVDPYCAYQWSNSDALLLASSVRRLLKWPKPLVLVDASDWACRASYPPTIHQVWRDSYGGENMENSRFLPIGVYSTHIESFVRNATAAQDTPVADRRFALAWMGSLSERKPERVHFHRLMSGGMLDELTAVAVGAGLDGVVYDMVRQGKNETSYDYGSLWGGAAYTEVLARARLVVVLAGDVWSDTSMWNALEYGAIPVVERRAGYKGCRDPTGWLVEAEAPVLWVDAWDELPAVLEAALADDDALEAQRASLVRWWGATKLAIGESMLEFSQHWQNPDASYPTNDCVSTALSDEREAVYQAELDSFYDDPHWFDNFEDSPWLEGMLCYKHKTQNWAGLQCYSPRCAEPSVETFTCGGQTLTASSF